MFGIGPLCLVARQPQAEKIMSLHSQISTLADKRFMPQYLDALALVERLHRLLLDVIKDEF